MLKQKIITENFEIEFLSYWDMYIPFKLILRVYPIKYTYCDHNYFTTVLMKCTFYFILMKVKTLVELKFQFCDMSHKTLSTRTTFRSKLSIIDPSSLLV